MLLNMVGLSSVLYCICIPAAIYQLIRLIIYPMYALLTAPRGASLRIGYILAVQHINYYPMIACHYICCTVSNCRPHLLLFSLCLSLSSLLVVVKLLRFLRVVASKKICSPLLPTCKFLFCEVRNILTPSCGFLKGWSRFKYFMLCAMLLYVIVTL